MREAPSFDAALRILECPQCGAPLCCQKTGGTVQCKYCRTESVVRMRSSDEGAGKIPSGADEVARQARLRAQVAHRVSGHAYDLTTRPAGLDLPAETHPEQTGDPVLAAWTSIKRDASEGREVDQHRACWLAATIAGSHFRAGDDERGRAVLETALDLLSDAAHRQIVRCQLAFEAAQRGDAEAATQWLAECDPAPELLELDSEYRSAAARLALARGESRQALRLVGPDLPVDESHRKQFAALRVAALEADGQHDEAYQAFVDEARELGEHELREVVASLALAPAALERRRVALLEEAAARRRRALEEARAIKRVARNVLLTICVLVCVCVAAIVGGRWLWARYEPFPLGCGGMPGDPEIVRIEDREAHYDGALVQGPYHCHVIIRNSKLRGTSIVKTGSNATVEIENSTLEATGPVLQLDNYDNDLTIRNSTLTTSGDKPAIWIGRFKSITIQDSTVESMTSALKVGWSGPIAIRGGELRAKNPSGAAVALSEHFGAEVYVSRARLVGGDAAIRGLATGTKLHFVRAHLEGGRTALDFDSAVVPILEDGTVLLPALPAPRAAASSTGAEPTSARPDCKPGDPLCDPEFLGGADSTTDLAAAQINAHVQRAIWPACRDTLPKGLTRVELIVLMGPPGKGMAIQVKTVPQSLELMVCIKTRVHDYHFPSSANRSETKLSYTFDKQ